VAQQYLPDELLDARYYEPGEQGAEARLVARWRERRGQVPPPAAPVGDNGG
jgi:putative ATPase